MLATKTKKKIEQRARFLITSTGVIVPLKYNTREKLMKIAKEANISLSSQFNVIESTEEALALYLGITIVYRDYLKGSSNEIQKQKLAYLKEKKKFFG